MSPSFRMLALSVVVGAVLPACGTTQFDVTGDEDDLVLSSEEGALRSNNEPNRVVVYSNNIENMIFDWKDLVHVMDEDALRPDIFLLQQVSGRDGLDRMIHHMNRRLGVDYDGVVAQNNPDDSRFGDAFERQFKVTTGVIFRSSRFELVGKDSWMPFGRGFANQVKSCDDRSNNSGYETLRVKLWDRVAKKHIVVVSLRHWTWHACSMKNVFEIIDGFDGGPNDHHGLGSKAALHIVGGDFNEKIFDGEGNYDCWYRELNRSLPGDGCSQRATAGFTDPLFESCNGEKACMKNRSHVDHLFVRRTDGEKARTSHFDIVSYDQGHRASVAATGGDAPSNLKSRDGYNDQAPRYSGHEARKTYVFYK